MGIDDIRRKINARIDPLGLVPAAASVAARAAVNPLGVAKANLDLAGDLAKIPVAYLRAAAGADDPKWPVDADPRDRRFSERTWEENPNYAALRQYYLAACGYVDGLREAGAGDAQADGKIGFMSRLVMDAMAPTNFLATNPEALIEAYRTGGRSVLKGQRFFIDDLLNNDGRPEKIDRTKFTLGEDMACTPGKVIFRNDLIEVMQYEPQTEQVHAVPLLVTPPWINKYYILDLTPGRSLIEMAVKSGRTVFGISYRQPDSSMADLGMDDYYREGTVAALDVVQEVTGAPKVDILALCLGGAMSAMATAKDAVDGKDRIGTLTLMNTMLDYTDPGEIKYFTGPEDVEVIVERMKAKGYLGKNEMADTFDLVRARDLIFNYWVSRWMKGEDPTAFDILVWNADSTNMPLRMHAEYMRSLYVDNALAEGDFVLDGTRLDMGAVKNDTYVVGAVGDHIVPWSTSYAAVKMLGGDVRYVQSNGGHLAGALNPPSKRTWYRAIGEPEKVNRGEYPSSPAEFEEKAPQIKGDSWWSDWNRWMSARAGEMVSPPEMGGGKYAPICDAPGEYVRSK
ncbi:PHA/PHB synthase family protein [Corynebacterium hansenii]|uniref:PHA/PHB synthase family protein n=1 Tax=Corynebacterium hansenii TaxID=394964 RepID=A0ABV7ZRT2_9CORY|nr:alpha/beta fold hydrolase [Corynebacterium hansenii]WJZ01174.1 Poly-beta-hydroxybutyrate polymerase [Corynebacterium hansenii]